MPLTYLSDLVGTMKAFLKIGGTSGVRLKNSAGHLLIRNTGDSADANITAALVNVSGNDLVLNSDAAESGADYKITLTRPTSGMSASYTLTLPTTDGSPNQVLSTDGSGVTSWVAAADTSANVAKNSTTIAFNESSPATLFTLPANAVIHEVKIIVDTQFDGTPTLAIGINGTTSKYAGTTDSDLTVAAESAFIVLPEKPASGGTEALIATYSAGGATAGSARVEIAYSVPS